MTHIWETPLQWNQNILKTKEIELTEDWKQLDYYY